MPYFGEMEAYNPVELCLDLGWFTGAVGWCIHVVEQLLRWMSFTGGACGLQWVANDVHFWYKDWGCSLNFSDAVLKNRESMLQFETNIPWPKHVCYVMC